MASPTSQKEAPYGNRPSELEKACRKGPTARLAENAVAASDRQSPIQRGLSPGAFGGATMGNASEPRGCGHPPRRRIRAAVGALETASELGSVLRPIAVR